MLTSRLFPCLNNNIRKFSLISEQRLLYEYYLNSNQQVRRRFKSDGGNVSSKLPSLMDFPKITLPSFVKTIRNFILTSFIVRPYLDNDFNTEDFITGSKKAVEVVSNKVSNGDVKSLSGLVTPDVIESLEKVLAEMSLSQREQIAVKEDDIYFSFPYEIGVIFNEDNDQKRFVEITMVYHVLKGLSLMRQAGEEPPINMGLLPEYQDKISVCNYRFIKECSKGVDSDWTINVLNHFKPIDGT